MLCCVKRSISSNILENPEAVPEIYMEDDPHETSECSYYKTNHLKTIASNKLWQIKDREKSVNETALNSPKQM